MEPQRLKLEIENSAILSFSRASGAGGQNVNKVNTRVQVHLRLSDISSLSENELAAVRAFLSTRITAAGELFVSVQNSRSQWHNRELALEKLFLLITQAITLSRRKPRQKTRPSRGAKEKRLSSKRLAGKRKQGRRKPTDQE